MSLRSRARRAARRVGRRLLGMEAQAEARAPRNPQDRDADARVDLSVIPRLQEGSGDTPGPNHKEHIGRTWVSAQILSGDGLVVLDVRSPDEWRAGILPRSVCVPASVVLADAGEAPAPGAEVMLAVVDAIGGGDADRVAHALRARGLRARKLVGGYAEWIEEGEEVATAEDVAGPYQLGDRVRLADGRIGQVWRVETTEPRYRILVQDSGESVRAAEGDLSA